MKNNFFKMIASGFMIWIVRLITALPFLDNEQRLPVAVTVDGRLPENVEIFFSILILALVITTLLCCLWLFRNWGGGSAFMFGLNAGLVMLIVVSAIDLILAVGLGTRTLGGWFVNQFLDLSPVLLIPLFLGVIIDKLTAP